MAAKVADLFSVKGKSVLITGGGAGIGQMMAQGFVENGANVYICSRKAEVCQKTADELNAIGPGKCYPLSSVDLANGKKECEKVIAELQSRYNLKSLDVLINNSGVSWGDNYFNFDESKGFDRLMAINVKSVFYLTMAAFPLLKAAGTPEDPARVINIGSIFGIMTHNLPTPSYDMSKAAVHHMTNKLSLFYAKYNVTVNAIAPGLIPTKMGAQADVAAGGNDVTAHIPLKRKGTIGDMAGAALYLSSPAGSWVTGVILPVAGGQQHAKM
eukprot:CAMPEP_0201515852 /NCGR_PEP_ID=MMETSP0161_2-20130828/7309_1 /ASSEMBLY_ACC=CAM_ASM_000251 /TAXON_ID=180227 /ORGANISM="Neoparamoeba aestuarina, Strain SoJaBio B1-5/56/2" /LENGTH=269 /DNA_ID=CAMNT_0047912785 /DNA_START=59 /DNA_END=868 /DNA_ORIENTATION=+